MLQLVNKLEAAQFVIIGNPGNRRIEFFQKALAELKLPPAKIVSFQALLAQKVALAEIVQPGNVVRIESPERDFEVEKALLTLGAQVEDEELHLTRYARLSSQALAGLTFEPGAILYPRQWFLGFRELLNRIEGQLAAAPMHHLMNRTADIITMFDKPACHSLLDSNGVPVPISLGQVHSYEELLFRMRETGCYRVFVKLAHGSSASGVVAYQVSGDKHLATTSVEMVKGTKLRLYNSRKIYRYQSQAEIAELIDTLCLQRVQVEKWLPKAGLHNRTFDLRVVVIGNEVRHVVVRLSRSTLTNLHLSNDRTNLEALLTRLKPEVWEMARQTCLKVMRLFPGSFYAGIDLMIASDYKKHAVAEVNAFGDLLYDTFDQGEDTYTAEIRAFMHHYLGGLKC